MTVVVNMKATDFPSCQEIASVSIAGQEMERVQRESMLGVAGAHMKSGREGLEGRKEE